MHLKRNGTLKQLQAFSLATSQPAPGLNGIDGITIDGSFLTPHGKTGSLFCQSLSRHDIHPLSGNLSPPRSKTRPEKAAEIKSNSIIK